MYNTPKPRGVTRIETALDDDLLPFSAHLWTQRIAHRIYEQQGRQVLEVQTEGAGDRVLTDYRAWRDGRLLLRAPVSPDRAPWTKTSRTLLGRYPCLVIVTLVTIVLYPATWALTDHDEIGPWLPWLTIVDVTETHADRFAALMDVLRAGQLWRFVTPAFLHFSLPHLGFNLAVVFGFGWRIERAAGSLHLAITIGLIAIVSNLVQYLANANGLFGGLSGVAYGLIGYVVVRGRREPGVRVWHTQPALILSLAVFLVLMTTGLTEIFGLYIANAAHWAGLALGALLGFVASRRVVR